MKMSHLFKSLFGLVCLVVLPATHMAAQQLTPTIVGSSGATLQAASGTANLSFTVGEAFIQTLGNTNQVALGQGFHNAALNGIVQTGEVFSDVEILLYPNPASEYLYATFNTTDNAGLNVHACIHDATGREVVKGLSFPASGRYSIPVYSLPDGMYALQFFNEKGQSNTFHFIKIR
ncbi:MAG: T9SS type A sorting domain-containing protein [Saprospiraceae bacterium]|nr:T9SS type A sorting domain-containing protein [Saprospiraceae bacterium]